MNDKLVAYNQPSPEPTPKMQSVAVSGALVTVLSFMFDTFTDLHVPIAVVVAIASILVFLSGYFTKDKQPSQIVREIKEAQR